MHAGILVCLNGVKDVGKVLLLAPGQKVTLMVLCQVNDLEEISERAPQADEQEFPEVSQPTNEASWDELIEQVSGHRARQDSLALSIDSQQGQDGHSRQPRWKAPSAEPHNSPRASPAWWDEDQISQAPASVHVFPEDDEPDEILEDINDRYRENSLKGADADWDRPDSESQPHMVLSVGYASTQEDTANREELQSLRERIEVRSGNEEALKEQVAVLKKQLLSAQVPADAHALLQKKCADLQWHIEGLEESAEAREEQYKALEQECEELQDHWNAQSETIAAKASQREKELATAQEELQAAQAAQQGLAQDKTALQDEVTSMTVQLAGVQHELHAAQRATHAAEAKAADMAVQLQVAQEKLHAVQEAGYAAEANAADMAAKFEALQAELAEQNEGIFPEAASLCSASQYCRSISKVYGGIGVSHKYLEQPVLSSLLTPDWMSLQEHLPEI